jgi:hypothetical protein
MGKYIRKRKNLKAPHNRQPKYLKIQTEYLLREDGFEDDAGQ